MHRRIVPTVAVFLAMLTTAAAWAADDVLNVIPESSLGFVVVNRLAETSAKIQELGKQVAAPDVPDMLSMLKARAGIREGLDEQGSAAIAVLPLAGKDQPPDTEPATVLFAPVTDYGKLIAQLGDEDAAAPIATVQFAGATFVARHVGSYAAFAEPRHRAVLEKAVGGASVASSLAAWRPWLAENDVAGVLLHSGVVFTASHARKGLEEIRKMSDQLGAEAAPMLAVLGIYGRLFEAAEKEVHVIGLGVRRDKQGVLHVASRTGLTPAGEAAKAVAGIPPAQGNLLAGLPAGPFALAFAGVVPQDAMARLTGFAFEMQKATLPAANKLSKEQAQKLLEESRDLLKGVSRVAVLVSVGKPDGALLGRFLSVTRVDDAAAYLDKEQKYLRTNGELLNDVKGPVPAITDIQRTEIDGRPALQASMDYQKMLESSGAAPGVPKEFAEKLFGSSGKLTVYMVAADQHTLVSGYASKDLLRRGLTTIQKSQPGLAAEKGIAATAKLLPPGAPWVAFWSPRGMLELVEQTVTAVTGGSIPGLSAADFPQTSPIGFAASTSPAELHTVLVVPPDVLKGIGTLVKKVQHEGQ